MRKVFENIKTIFAELIGLIGGFFWARHVHWDYEPLILVIGSGAAFLFSIVLVFFKEKKESQQETIIKSEDSTITNIDPEKIVNQIGSAPLYQQEGIANHFTGINVRWSLKLYLVHKRGNNQILVTMATLDKTNVKVSFETNIDKYPILKIAEDKKI